MNKDKRIIVSFTSYPKRIGKVHTVLESLYAQSLKPDLIILWLAEEQFPNREADLPIELIEDKNAGKYELRWCDDLGSHKKYFYAMQEFPEDIIITVDDDNVYHYDTVKTLCELHRKYPGTVACLFAKLMLFDNKYNLLPYTDWLYNVVLPVPSMQIIPMGSGGVLYPPHVLDKGVFDKETILSKFKYRGVICGDDIWLKTHSMLAGIPTVTQDQYTITNHILFSSDSIGTLNIANQQQHNRLLDVVASLRSADGKQSVQDIIMNAHKNGDFYDLNSALVRERTYQFVLEKLNIRIAAVNNSRGDAGKNISIGHLHYVLSFFTTAMTYGDAELSGKYIAKLKESFLKIPDINEISGKSKFVDALLKYDAVLLDELNIWHQQAKNYYQMLRNWNSFFSLFKESGIPQPYMLFYMRFLTNMSKFSKRMDRNVYSPDQIETFNKDIRKAWKQISLGNKIHFTARRISRYISASVKAFKVTNQKE